MDRNALIRKGFVATPADGPLGEAWALQRRLEDFPYAREHLIDGDCLCEGMPAVLEITADGCVQFRVDGADYLEGPYAFDSEDGQALLAEAGA